MITLAGDPYRYDDEEAFQVLAGYALGTVPPARPKRVIAYGSLPELPERPRWGYRSYDCIPASPGHALSGVDLVIASGLNGRIGARAVLSMQLVAEEVGECLARLDGAGVPFWDIDPNQFGKDAAPGRPASTSGGRGRC